MKTDKFGSFLKNPKNKWLAIIIIFLIGSGIFLRAYNFTPWLHFEIDQSYDTLIVSSAVDHGIGNLPLLGPTAGGGRALRLGPAFYYLEYLSAKIFGNTPPGHAALVLVLSILTLPLFYLFCRKYFSPLVSVGLLAIASFSLYLVLYGRFSWSPNILPFFTLLSFYALLRSTSPAEPSKDTWFLIFVAIGTITTQIHFNAFFILPPTAILFLFFARPKINWKAWLAAFFLIFALYSPLILSEVKTGGQDTRYFFQKISEQSYGGTSFWGKLNKDASYTANEYFLIDTGLDNINFEKEKYSDSLISNPLITMSAFTILALEVIILVYNIVREKERERKNFLILLGSWFFISFAYFYFIASHDVFPRFFLMLSPLALLLLGLLLEKIRPEKNKLFLSVFLAVLLLIIYSNALKIRTYFSQLAQAQTQALPVQTKDVLPNTARLTFRQEEEIADYITRQYQKNNYPVYLKASHEYGPALWYLLEHQGIDFSGEKEDELSLDYNQGNYFVVAYLSDPVPNEKNFTIAETKNFGLLQVYNVIPNDAASAKTIHKDQTNTDVSLQATQINDIYTWNTLSGTKQINPDNYPDEDLLPADN